MIRDRIGKGARRVAGGLKRRLKAAMGQGPRESPWASAPASPPAAPPAPASSFEAEPAPAEGQSAIDGVGSALTVDQVIELFDDMVRPALQSDGGDIDLVKVEDNDVYVRLTGACSSCPSSTVTMKMGIERLLVEEFPQFRHLIQVA